MKNETEKLDLRYITKDESRDFHKKRRAFVIYKDELHFIEKGSEMSHWEFCQKYFPEMAKDEFNQITRGYYLDGDLVFYKDNFYYDDSVIKEALNYITKIKEALNITEVRINFGLVIGKPGENWPIDYCYGKSLENNEIKLNDERPLQ